MKKAFTLVELLAVIVILAIILAIAIPGISSIIDNVKLQSYINNEDMMVKATKTYIGINDSYLPANIGATKEVKLSDLQTNNYIGTITDPNDKNVTCDGYVLITKVDANNYDYTPQLDCINNAGSLAEDSLVGYWKLDGNLFDSSGNGHNGINYGATPTANRFGVANKAMDFNGTSNYADLTYGSGLNPSTSPHSFTMWVKSDNPTGAQMFMTSGQAGGSDNRFYLSTYYSKWDIGIYTGLWGAGTIASSSNWTYITVVMNGTTATLYVNGVSGRVISYSSYTFNKNIYLARHDGGDYWFDGAIDDIKIYSRALTGTEIKHNYSIERIVSR